MFNKILVANRGEIAVRIIATARAMGIGTVAVYSEVDAASLHVRLADEAVCIGPAPATESYLDTVAIVRAALNSGADAVHPGYGFLSENAEFATAVGGAGLRFIGPAPETIAAMGDKLAARAAAIAADVPVLPGSESTVSNFEEASALAREIGYPVVVKACFGGGGRGMRVAADEGSLEAALPAAEREARAAFGRSEMFLESYVARPRHVEVQVLGDTRGNLVHLGDRDCTVQRRHQKLIEEAPAPDLPKDVRRAIRSAAVDLCRSVDYVGAGTVEFLFDPSSGDFHFLELNTRLQVEHGVTELVTGVDLVEAQIEIAAGLPLRFTQEKVRLEGHAIQARITAEDPWRGFCPAPGELRRLRIPFAPFVRCDSGVEQGDIVSAHYDSMFAKLLAWGRDRDSARVRLAAALERLEVEGVPTTAPYLAQLLCAPDFIAIRHFTGSVESDWTPDSFPRPPVRSQEAEDSPSIINRISERVVHLAGGSGREVAVFGIAEAPPLVAEPSARAPRSDTNPGRRANEDARTGKVHSPMDGVVVQTPVSAGETIKRGEPLLVLEAMKMEVVVPAPIDGLVNRVLVEPGMSIRKDQLLVELD